MPTRNRQAQPPPLSGAAGITLKVWAFVALAALTVAVFAPICTFDFVPWDDPLYVTQNSHVLAGLTRAGIAWAFTTGESFYWHPLTWLTHMLDVQVFGLNAGGHHFLNLILHLASTLVLFHSFRAMTGRVGRSAFVAALFAMHPLHVESVAWVAERKDVLSGFFYILSIAAYASYVRAPSRTRYLSVIVAFALGLMSKPMIVTLPFALVLLDVWPLGRLSLNRTAGADRSDWRSTAATASRLLVEKLPLVAMSVAAGVATLIAQAQAGSVRALEGYPAGLRLANAVISYVAYVGDMFWPAGLAAYYPYPAALPSWASILAAVACLSAICVAVILRIRTQPYLAVGWFWFLGSLLPVIGLIQVGDQARADRFTYVPLIGLFVMLSWGVSEALARSRRISGAPIKLAAIGAVAACAVVSSIQVHYWKDGFALWLRAEAVTTPNQRVYASLGLLLEEQGRIDEAIVRYRQALPFMRNASGLHGRIGGLLMRQGRAAEAVKELEAAVETQPESAVAHSMLAAALDASGQASAVVEHLQTAVRLQPGSAVAHRELGLALNRQNRSGDGVLQLAEAVRLRPDWALARISLSLALREQGRLDAAVGEASEAVRLEPENAEWHSNLSVLLGERGDLGGAVQQLEAALRLAPRNPEAAAWHYNLAAFLGQMGAESRSQVVAHLEAALALSPGFDEARRALAEINRR